jgi:formylglycine-generating enzyme required for sulfatase activity
MNDQVVFVIIAIVAVLVLVSFVFSDINKGKQAAERLKILQIEKAKKEKELRVLIDKVRQDEVECERLLSIEHEKKVAELKKSLRIEKEQKEQELRISIDKVKQDKAERARLRVEHDKEVDEFERSCRIEKEKNEEQVKVINDLVRQNELFAELTISIADRDYSRNLYSEEGEYANKLLDIEQPNFLKIYNISKWHVLNLKSVNPECAKNLFERVQGGLDILTTSDELHQYKFAFDQKHNAKLQSAFKELILKTSELDIPLSGNLDIIDWGCGQALATFLFVDYLLSSGIDNLFNKIILIEPSEIALKRGVAIINKRVKCTSLHPLIKVVNKKLDQVDVSDISTFNANVKLHLFSNILDVPGLDIRNIFSIISNSQRNINYFICVSPDQGDERNAQLDLFSRLFENKYKTVSISKRDDAIPFTLFGGGLGNAKRYEIMFFSNIISSDSSENVERKSQWTNDEIKKIRAFPPLRTPVSVIKEPAALAPTELETIAELQENYVLIRGGEFTMGSPEGDSGRAGITAYWQKIGKEYSETQHQVRLSNFSMSRYAVTVAEFKRFVDATGYRTDAENGSGSRINNGSEFEIKAGVNWRHGVSGNVRPQSEENHPVLHVSWNDAVGYCRWFSEQTGKSYRLPTEAEWEYACRAGSHTPFNTGENLTTSQANYDGNFPYNNNLKGVYRQNTVPVDSLAHNAWGLYNMHGNVWEWCSDWFCGTYYDECKANGTVTNPAGPATGSYRVIRGGSWNLHAARCRSALRIFHIPDARFCNFGFRLVLDQSLKAVDRCTQPFPADSPTKQLLQDTLKHGLEFDSYKQHTKVTRIHGSQGKETSLEFCCIPVDKAITVKDFYLGKYPVTQQQWEAVMGNNPSHFKGGSLPVETVSFDDAQIFIQKLNQLSGKQHYRLPTEEEWEYCCRAGSTSAYYFGDYASQLGEYVWYSDNSGNTTHPVGQKKPNEWGLYDMAGNVWEWTDSWYDISRSRSVLRGGCWYAGAERCRSANRYSSNPGRRNYSIGFRLVFVP